MKLRINLTVEDYYDYVGTNPFYSKRKRVLGSLPYEFKGLYNLKFKEIKRSWTYKRWYRVHFSINMTEEEFLSIIESYKDYCHKPEEVTYKIIKKSCNGKVYC